MRMPVSLRTFGALSSGAVLVAVWIVSLRADWVERFYAQGIWTGTSPVMSAFSGLVPFSLAEVSLVILVALIVLSLVRVLREAPVSRLHRLGSSVVTLLVLALVGLALFYLLWGLSYFRPPLAQRMSWDSSGPLFPQGVEQARQELSWLCRSLVDAANRSHLQAWGEGAEVPAWDMAGLHQALEDGFARLGDRWGLGTHWRRRRSPPKPILFSWAASYLGVAGFYFPWTSEAHFNTWTPDSQLPHVVAHEKAHQRGIAGEDEANFIGLLACLESDLPEVRFSGELFAGRQLLRELSRFDRAEARRIASLRSPEVQREIKKADRFWRGMQGPASRAGNRVNHLYLRAHGVVGGIDSYRLSSRLMILYARANDGGLLVSAER